MSIKVAKFGGSSVADALQVAKLKEILDRDPDIKYVIVSAPGKRFDKDSKITDLLYACQSSIEQNLPHEQLFQVVKDRYTAMQMGMDVMPVASLPFVIVPMVKYAVASSDAGVVPCENVTVCEAMSTAM